MLHEGRCRSNRRKSTFAFTSSRKHFALVPSVLHYSDLKYFVCAHMLACIVHGRRLACISVSIHFVIQHPASFVIQHTLCNVLVRHCLRCHLWTFVGSPPLPRHVPPCESPLAVNQYMYMPQANSGGYTHSGRPSTTQDKEGSKEVQAYMDLV